MTGAFAAAGLAPTFLPNNAGTLPGRIRQAACTGAEVVAVAGGDGTIACAHRTCCGPSPHPKRPPSLGPAAGPT